MARVYCSAACQKAYRVADLVPHVTATREGVDGVLLEVPWDVFATRMRLCRWCRRDLTTLPGRYEPIPGQTTIEELHCEVG